MIPDLLPFLSNKNPQVKEGTLKFLHRCLATTTIPPQPAQVKPLGESLAGLLGDGTESVRTEAAGALGTVMKIVGERAMNPILEPLDDLRKTKVKEAFEKATVKSKAGAGGPPKALPKAAPAPSKPAPAKKAPPKPAAPIEEDTLAPAPAPTKPSVADELAELNAEVEAKPKRAPPARFLVCQGRV